MRKLTKKQRAYVEKAIPIVEVVIRSLHKSFPGITGKLASIDAVSVAHLAICRAAKTYDPSRSQISAYFSAAIRNALLKELARSQKWKCDRRSDVVHELAKRQEPRQSHQDGRLRMALAMLPDYTRQLIASRYFEGKSVTEIAANTDQNPKTVRAQLKRSLALLEELLGSHDEQLSQPSEPSCGSTPCRLACAGGEGSPRPCRSSCLRRVARE